MRPARLLRAAISTLVLVWSGTCLVSAESPEPFKPNFNPTLQIRPLAGTIAVDGDLSDSGWQNAGRAGGFAEVNPGDNTVPAVRSAVLATYDESRLYLAFIAWDDPSQVRASLSDRDNIFNDDYFGVLLDTYGDYAWGYEIFVNPFGIQGDMRILSNGSEDISLDLVFDSRGIVTDSGYQVELAIPFASLRFPDRPEQNWRVNFWRDRQRDNRYQYFWAAQNRDNSCFVCQWGTLTGLKDVKPGSNLDILPNVISHQSGAMHNNGVPDSDFGNDDPDAELALNARYSLTTNSSVEIAVNPDFSQVESDAGQIDVNETFALYYPERRPFFQEGSDLYQAYFNVIHTRMINDPILAGKFTGQFGRFSVAYLVARDDHTPYTIPLRERSTAVALESSTSNIIRGRRTFGQDSFVGFVLTDRRTDHATRIDSLYSQIDDTLWERSIDTVRYSAGTGTTYGIDSRIRIDRNYQARFMVLGSYVREPGGEGLVRDTSLFDYGSHTVALDGEKLYGQALSIGLERGGRYWGFGLNYTGISPTFRPDNGFMTANDRQDVNFQTNVVFRPNRKWLVSWGPSMTLGRTYNYRATVNVDPGTFNSGTRDEWFRPQIFLEFKGQTELDLAYLASREWFQGRLFTGISRGFIEVYSHPSGAFEFGADLEYGRKVVRNLPVPRMGILTNGSVWTSFKLSQRLRVEPDLEYQKMDNRDNYLSGNPGTDRTIYSVSILRTRINYQFTREWFLRLIFEYGDNNNIQDPNYLIVEPLLTYRINPFTLFYVGASWGSRHFAEGYEFAREMSRPDGFIAVHADQWDNSTWRMERAQVFAKFQYLFRL